LTLSSPLFPYTTLFRSDLAGGGRVVRDRLWYFGSARRKEYRQEVIGYAGQPGADGAYFTADDVPGNTTDRESNVVGKFTAQITRSEEHTSELQSLRHLV